MWKDKQIVVRLWTFIDLSDTNLAALPEQILMARKNGIDLPRDEFRRLLRRPPDKLLCIKDIVQTVMHGFEIIVFSDQVDQIILFPFELDVLARFHGKDADLFMQFLPVSARLDTFHHDVLRRHEGKFRRDMFCDDLVIDDEIVRDIHIDIENGVHRKECLCIDDPAVGRIVERTLEPLRGTALFIGSESMYRASDPMRSQRMGLRL